MSLCEPCTRLRDISFCTDEIVIGTVSEINTEYNIYFRNLGSGEIQHFTTTSDNDGLLTLTPPYGFAFASNTLYELWVNRIDSVPYMDELTIDGTASDCFSVSFFKVKDTTYESQTLQLP